MSGLAVQGLGEILLSDERDINTINVIFFKFYMKMLVRVVAYLIFVSNSFLFFLKSEECDYVYIPVYSNVMELESLLNRLHSFLCVLFPFFPPLIFCMPGQTLHIS